MKPVIVIVCIIMCSRGADTWRFQKHKGKCVLNNGSADYSVASGKKKGVRPLKTNTDLFHSQWSTNFLLFPQTLLVSATDSGSETHHCTLCSRRFGKHEIKTADQRGQQREVSRSQPPECRRTGRKDRNDDSSTEREQNMKSWSHKGNWESWAYRNSLCKRDSFHRRDDGRRDGGGGGGLYDGREGGMVGGSLWAAHWRCMSPRWPQLERWTEQRRAKFANSLHRGWGVEEQRTEISGRVEPRGTQRDQGDPGDGCHWKYITPIIWCSCVLARKVRDHL